MERIYLTVAILNKKKRIVHVFRLYIRYMYLKKEPKDGKRKG